jgi:hypothetical protein
MSAIPLGSLVMIKDLQARPEINGAVGIVKKEGSGVERVRVKLTGAKVFLSLRPSNLQILYRDADFAQLYKEMLPFFDREVTIAIFAGDDTAACEQQSQLLTTHGDLWLRNCCAAAAGRDGVSVAYTLCARGCGGDAALSWLLEDVGVPATAQDGATIAHAVVAAGDTPCFNDDCLCGGGVTPCRTARSPLTTLLRRRAAVDAPDRRGDTPPAAACRTGAARCAAALIAAGARVDGKLCAAGSPGTEGDGYSAGDTCSPLAVAVRGGHLAAARLLLAAGARVWPDLLLAANVEPALEALVLDLVTPSLP